MITLNMTLFPCGSGIGRSEILTGSIWTTDCGRFHAYSIQHGDVVHEGKIVKENSGHRNPFELLYNVAADVLDTIEQET